MYQHLNKISFLSATVNTILDQLYQCSEEGVELVLDMEEGIYNLFNVNSTQPKAYPLNIQLEYKIFEAVSTPDLLHGVLYLLPIFYQGKLFIRYICSGSYTGLLPQMITLLQKEYNVMDKDTYPWEVYTQKDIQMNSSKIGTPHHHPTTYNRKVGSQNTAKSNKNSVFSLLNRCKPSLEESYSILFIHKMQAHPTNPTHRQVIHNIILPWGSTSPHVGAGTSPFFFGPPDSFRMHLSCI